jgi:hypothetical protein
MLWSWFSLSILKKVGLQPHANRLFISLAAELNLKLPFDKNLKNHL